MVNWKIKKLLELHGISAYKLGLEFERLRPDAGRSVMANNAYRLTRETIKRPDFETLDLLIQALRNLTGQEVNVQDILEFIPD
jgi:hypothetical protein